MRTIKSFFKKTISVIVIVFAAIVSFFFLSGLTRKEEEESVDRLKGRNDILDKNTIRVKEDVDSLNKEIEQHRNNIKNIEKEKNNEGLDSFFDKRGF